MKSTFKIFSVRISFAFLFALLLLAASGSTPILAQDSTDAVAAVSDVSQYPKDEFPDLLHPNAIGYEKWANALKPIFAKLDLQTAAP